MDHFSSLALLANTSLPETHKKDSHELAVCGPLSPPRPLDENISEHYVQLAPFSEQLIIKESQGFLREQRSRWFPQRRSRVEACYRALLREVTFERVSDSHVTLARTLILLRLHGMFGLFLEGGFICLLNTFRPIAALPIGCV